MLAAPLTGSMQAWEAACAWHGAPLTTRAARTCDGTGPTQNHSIPAAMRSLPVPYVLFMLVVGFLPVANAGLLKTFDYEVIKFAQDPVRERIYATTTHNSVIVIDTETITVSQEIFIGSLPRGLDVNADGSRLYVACSGSTTEGIGVIDLTT